MINRSPKVIRNERVMKTFCIAACMLAFALPGLGQTTTGTAETKGPCSPAVTGNSNTFKINCAGITKEQGDRMLQILNTILSNQLKPQDVMAKLDEILKAVNPNVPTKVYRCDGAWSTAGPGSMLCWN